MDPLTLPGLLNLVTTRTANSCNILPYTRNTNDAIAVLGEIDGIGHNAVITAAVSR